MTDRATIRVIDSPEGPAGVAPAGPEPESLPPAAAIPPQEQEPDIGGGDAFQAPQPEEIVAAEGGSLKDQMMARFEQIAATEEFAVPGWELENGEPGLIIVARTFGDRKAYTTGVSNEAFIARSTHELYFVDDAGHRQKIEGGWGPALAAIMGVSVTKAADLVAIVISKPDPANRTRRIPNVAGIGSLATEIILWSRKGVKDAEETLGG